MAEDPPNPVTEEDSSKALPKNSLYRRHEQLQRWKGSPTDREPMTLKYPAKRVKFNDGCMFLAACSSGDIEEVKNFLKKGVDINTANIDGLTALHQACIDNNIKMVEFLVENNTDVNVCDNEGWTPLHATASCGFSEIARYLIDNGADVGAVNNDGDLPFDICEDCAMEKLLQDEMDKQGVDMVMARSAEENAMLVDANQWLNNRNIKEKPHSITGATALHVAAAKGYIKVIKVLLQAGANINAVDFDGWTPLHAAAHWGQEEVCRLLAENACDMTIENFSLQTAFDVADESLLDLLEELKTKQATLRDKSNLQSEIIENKSKDRTRRSSVTRMSMDQKMNVQHKTREGERAILSTNEVIEKSSSSSGSEDDTTDSETEKRNTLNKQASESAASNGGDVIITAPESPVTAATLTPKEAETSDAGEVKTPTPTDSDDVFEPKPTLSRAMSAPAAVDSPVAGKVVPRSDSVGDAKPEVNDSSILGRYSPKRYASTSYVPYYRRQHAKAENSTGKDAETDSNRGSVVEITDVDRLQKSDKDASIKTEEARPPVKRFENMSKSNDDIQKRLQAISKPTEELQKRLDAARALREAKAQDGETSAESKPPEDGVARVTDSEIGGGAATDISTERPSSVSTVPKNVDSNLPMSPKSPTARSRFEPPSRDEEAELQRKARAKRSRETRRPTQGVTQDEVIQAQEALRQTTADATTPTVTTTTTMPATTAPTTTTLTVTRTSHDITDSKPDSTPNPDLKPTSDPAASRVPLTDTTSSMLATRRARTWQDRKEAAPREDETRTPALVSRRARFPSSLSSSTSSVPSIDDSTSRSLPLPSAYVRNSYTGSTYDATPNAAITRSVSLRRSRLSDLEHRDLDEKKEDKKDDKTDDKKDDKKEEYKDDKNEKAEHEPKQSSAIRARRKRSERHPTGINDPSIIGKENEDANKDEVPPKVDNTYYSRALPAPIDTIAMINAASLNVMQSIKGRYSRPVSYSELSKSTPSLDSQDYKKCYEEEKCENERLRKDLDQTKRDLENTQRELERTLRKRDADSKQERRTLERKVSEQEEELKKLKEDFDRVKQENQALIRVISRLSR